MTFHYSTGEEVLVGDRVQTTDNREGVVEQIILPGTEDSVDYQVPDGGILIREMWESIASYLMLGPPDGVQWEDLKLIARVSDTE